MVLDAREKEIAIDSYVRYVDTGTIGKVVEVKTSSDIEWVRIDKTDLWYRANLVELLDAYLTLIFTPLISALSYLLIARSHSS